jgi:hypothetical protein
MTGSGKPRAKISREKFPAGLECDICRKLKTDFAKVAFRDPWDEENRIRICDRCSDIVRNAAYGSGTYPPIYPRHSDRPYE